MKAFRFILVCLCVLTLSLAALAQEHAVTAPKPEAPPPTTSPTTGKIQVMFNITIADSWIPSSDTIACEVTISVAGEQSIFREVAAGAGSRSGNTGSCVIPVHYSWLLQNPSTDTINLTYDVAVPPETATNLTLPYRDSQQSGSITPVPASGSDTHITIDVTL